MLWCKDMSRNISGTDCPSDLPEFAPDGSVTLRFTWADVPSFYRYILSFGDAAEIISPEEYREGFGALLKKISAIY
ncbi:MAG: WYL domain-containing protein [Oscillospiraceae bacterium]